ncbi:MAG TPA: HNH endonuclease [Streptomyces sp.]|uniref:HNH endonuclease n=1 Tax=unclassified Streptomyces TaxID=2593676 RepID=UPI001BEA7F1A|nr:HNH endonuclease [Streptomyces sp. ISL-1]MBT2389652.1 HNH endonuclease [Streptomyces sp. ISL-1]HZX36973.1 HNH endonuclease [Streptomyces sp.]
MAVRYTRELLDEAARETTSFDDAVRWCGGNPTPGSRRYLRAKMAEAGIDTSHFTPARVRHTEETLRELVACSRSVAEVVRRLGINPVGGNQAHIGRRIAALRIDTSHFLRAPRGRPKGALGNRLVLGSPADGRIPGERLRRELLGAGIEESCAICGTGTEWNGKPLRLEVDHRNGDWWDNRPSNLRLLCPNCHAVTDTYRGRNRRGAA